MVKPLTSTALTLACCATLLAWSHAARLRSTAARHAPAPGLVVGVTDAGRVQVALDDIAGYMPAMTMAFAMGPQEAARPAAGDRIRFTLRAGEDGAWMEG